MGGFVLTVPVIVSATKAQRDVSNVAISHSNMGAQMGGKGDELHRVGRSIKSEMDSGSAHVEETDVHGRHLILVVKQPLSSWLHSGIGINGIRERVISFSVN